MDTDEVLFVDDERLDEMLRLTRMSDLITFRTHEAIITIRRVSEFLWDGHIASAGVFRWCDEGTLEYILIEASRIIQKYYGRSDEDERLEKT